MCKRVARLWGADSATEASYEDLSLETKNSWAALAAVFNAKWNKKAKHTLSEATSLLEILQKDALTDKQLVELVTMNDRPTPRLLSWWRTTNNLVLMHHIPDTLAERFCSELKEVVLRDLLPEVNKWDNLNTAIQGLSLTKYKDHVALFVSTTKEQAPEKEKAATPPVGEQGAHTSMLVEDLVRVAQALSLGNANPVSHVQPTSYYAQAAAPRWTGAPLNVVRARPLAPIVL